MNIKKMILIIIPIFIFLLIGLLVLIEQSENEVLTDILSIAPLPTIIIVLIIYGLIENKNNKKIEEQATELEKEKLEILGTQKNSGYVKNYDKKLALVLVALLVVIALTALMFKYANILTSFASSGTYLLVVGIVFVIVMLVLNFIIIYKKTKSESIMIKLVLEKYSNAKVKRLSNVSYPDGNDAFKEGIIHKLVDNYIIDIPQSNIILKEYSVYNIERYKRNIDETYSLIPQDRTVLNKTVLEYSYPINKNIYVEYTNDFNDVVDLQNNMELITNIKNLLESRFLSFKIENNRLYISKTIKNTGINEEDCIKDINDIELFKEKIVDVINRQI